MATAPVRATAPVELPTELDRPEAESQVLPETPWVTVVWNDPVNLMSYVAYVFRTYFGYPRTRPSGSCSRSTRRAGPWSPPGTREEMERDVVAMHGYGLWATLQQDG